jgi:hypothetical protein
LEPALNDDDPIGNGGRSAMTEQASRPIRPRPPLRQTLQDGQRYFALAELLDDLQAQIEQEAAVRGPGRRGFSRRALALNRSLGYGRRMLRLLQPLCGIPEADAGVEDR